MASRSLEILHVAHLAELPVVARAMEGVRASHLANYVSYVQKALHGVVDGSKVAKNWHKKSALTTKLIGLLGLKTIHDNSKKTTQPVQKDEYDEETDD